MEELEASDLETGAWFLAVGSNKLYARFRHKSEAPIHASAGEWLFPPAMLAAVSYFTDDYFFVRDKMPYRYAVLSDYKIKISADPHEYSRIKTNALNMQLLKTEAVKSIVSDDIIGLPVQVENTNGFPLEKTWVKNFTEDFDTITLKLQDQRSRYTDTVVDQQYVREEYRNQSDGLICMDEDTGKRYKQDAIGYCRAVPCDCLNGYAFDQQSYRKYRACYGKVEVDYHYSHKESPDNMGVEVEIENGWMVLKKADYAGEPTSWWTEEIPETLPSGIVVMTTLICIPNLVAHPPDTGFTIPKLEATPRKLRVTGTFHAERPNIVKVHEIFKYLIYRYAVVKLTDKDYNTTEIINELSAISEPIGIVISEPKALVDVIADLQGGTKYGWQFCSYKGLMTARVDLPDRPVAWEIRETDILNIEELSVDADSESFVTRLVVEYAKNWTEKTSSTIINPAAEEKAKMLHNVSQNRIVSTLLKNEADARERFRVEMADSLSIYPVVSGIQLQGRKWFDIRQYDRCAIKLSVPAFPFSGGIPLYPDSVWTITNVVMSTRDEIVTIDVKKKAA
ncbi:MAG: hypothetical protein LBP76_10955 [Treponema sp.]|nr:hypothetical protein [Treponema sp.]